MLEVEVNSQPRARRIRGEIEERLGERAIFESEVTTPLEMTLPSQALAARGREGEGMGDDGALPDAIDLASLPEVQVQLRAHLSAHWDAWLDEPIPALRDQTPREAARSESGRELLDALLLDYERSNERLGERGLGPDVAELRRKLGI